MAHVGDAERRSAVNVFVAIDVFYRCAACGFPKDRKVLG